MKVCLVRFGKKLDSARVVGSLSEAYDLIVDIIKNRKQIHHPTQGADTIQRHAEIGDVLIIEYELGSMEKPKKILGATKDWNKEIEARGCQKSRDKWGWEIWV